jgi:2-keto-4-pentenoate hydratase/2-oxohepta-3-ene-1,7-dioic acid hydratase in catechol pathway
MLHRLALQHLALHHLPRFHEEVGVLMRLVSFSRPGEASAAAPDSPRPGLVVDDEVVDLADPSLGLPSDMAALLALGPAGLDRVREAPFGGAARYPFASVRRHAPVPRPPVILAIGMNYRAHVAEMGREPPEYQYWFNKQRTAISGPGDPIVLPTVSTMVDYEGELAMVIGPRCQHVPAARAMEVVAGFTIINDVSARDWQWRTPTFTVGKSFDTHAPVGPWVVTIDELGDPGNLSLRTWVNDDLRQDSTTADLIFDCATQIEYLTTAFPLEPGTIIATGTPAGVGAGFTPPRFLADGDVVRIEIEGIGELSNPVVQGAAPVPSGLG